MHGFHQSMSARLDMENIDRHIVEIHYLIRNGARKATWSQDPKALVFAYHMICPSFMVEKADSTKGRHDLFRPTANRKSRTVNLAPAV